MNVSSLIGSFLVALLACGRIGSVYGQAGAKCTGKLLGKRGTCSDEVVDLGDRQETIKTYCYAPIASDMSRKAANSMKGSCFVPRSYPCDSDSQCRPGTQCLPNGQDHSLVCDVGDFEQTVLDMDTTLKIVHKTIGDLLEALQQRDGALVDTKTGVVSPILVATGIPLAQRLDYVQGILSSFASGRFKDMGETSRSGATFMFSGDHRFIAKTVRPGEFVVFVDELLPALCRRLPLDVPCANDTCDWPKLAVSSTTLNVPVVAFKNKNGHFLILPTVNTLRQEALTVREKWSSPTLYDIKPLRAHSHQRVDFVRWLAESQLFPAREDAPESVRSQWDSLLEMMYADMAFLQAISIVDYSFLVETYEDIDVQDPGPQCVSLPGCFSNASTPCRVMCLSTIDYTLKYDTTLKAIESKVIRNKWDDYEEKAKHLAKCIGNMGFGAHPSSSDTQPEVHFRYNLWDLQPCQIYGDLVCNQLTVTTLKDCDYHLNRMSDCDDPTCVFEEEDSHMCKPFLTPNCQAKIASAKVGHVGWHVVTSMARANHRGASHYALHFATKKARPQKIKE